MKTRLSFVKIVRYIIVCRRAFGIPMIEYYDGYKHRYQWFIVDKSGDIFVAGTIHDDIHQCVNVIFTLHDLLDMFDENDGFILAHAKPIAHTENNGQQLCDDTTVRALIRTGVQTGWVYHEND